MTSEKITSSLNIFFFEIEHMAGILIQELRKGFIDFIKNITKEVLGVLILFILRMSF